MEQRVKGISFLNPVDIEEGYLKKCAEYAIAHNVTHFEIIGPTHSPVKGNCDGMMLYRKYAEFNSGKENQKLDRVERVKYVTEILYNACKRLGKELIVRPFASIARDYDDLISAYEQISAELPVCDKWTKYDWSLTLPHNAFLARIKQNPLIVEGDIFGEYFGKGFLPVMLKDHITKKIAYCEGFSPRGYVVRIDRSGFIPFGTPNEVNLEIMDAAMDGRDIDEAIDAYFAREYGEHGAVVRQAMEGTEGIQIKAIYAEGYPLHLLSLFPRLAAMKKTYRVFRDDYDRTKAG